jgi:hypothetical protein
MSRKAPPRPRIPEIKPMTLTSTEFRRVAEVLGLPMLPDLAVTQLACVIAYLRATLRSSRGHTPAAEAATLLLAEEFLSKGGHHAEEATQWLSDLRYGMSYETGVGLAPIVADPEVPDDQKIAAIKARREEVAERPFIDPKQGARVTWLAYALVCIWHDFAVRRDDAERQWQFVLLVLEVAGDAHGGIRKNPQRLKRDFGKLLEVTRQA